MLIKLISKDVKDGRVISLIRKYLKSGVMINGIVMSTETGAPQGGPLSPLLSNIMLHELDMELTKRKLKLKVNENKSKVDNPWKLKFLGFSFYKIKGKCTIRVHQNSVSSLKVKLKELTSRSNAMNIGYRLLKIKQAIKPGNMQTQERAIGEYLKVLFWIKH